MGLSLWAGGEYQHPIDRRRRLRAGGTFSRREYAGGEFDRTFASVHAGPRWLLNLATEASLLAREQRKSNTQGVGYRRTGAELSIVRLF